MSNDFGNIPNNPYQAPAWSGQAPAAMVKPVSMTVFGVINLVWGAMGLCGIVASTVQIFVLGSNPAMKNPVIDLMNANPVYWGFMMLSMIVGFLFTIVLMIGGVGLLNGRPYGRKCSIVYAIYAIIAAIVGTVFNFIFLLLPLLQQADGMAAGPEKAGLIGGAIGGTVGGVCGVIYPIVLLIFMMRAPIVNYMRAQQ